ERSRSLRPRRSEPSERASRPPDEPDLRAVRVLDFDSSVEEEPPPFSQPNIRCQMLGSLRFAGCGCGAGVAGSTFCTAASSVLTGRLISSYASDGSSFGWTIL